MKPIEKEILENKALLEPIPAKDRVLLLPHCLRRSAHCQATYQRELGMQCKKCDPECPIKRILEVAETRGLNGICVAPGGSIAVEFLKKHKPLGILAVACPKELIMGVEAVNTMSDNGWEPAIVTIGLLKDGCIDTEVDVDLVIEFLEL